MKMRFAALLLAVLVILAGCGAGETSNGIGDTLDENGETLDEIEEMIRLTPEVDVPSDFSHIPFSPNDQGLYEVLVPVNLLGGKKADGVIKDFDNGNDFGPDKIVSDIRANPDGTAIYVFSEEQFLKYKYLMYANPHREYDSVVSVEYEDIKRMTSIVVTVDKEEYVDIGEQRIWVNLYGALYAGMYQILCGVPPEEWHTVITVKDDETGETISQWKFPFDNMYKTFDWLAPQTPLTDSGGEGSADKEANE